MTRLQVNSGLKAPFAWYGGKAYYAKWIIGQFPEHKVYVEPFGGAANVLLRKAASEVEVFNDLDDRIVNLFSVVRSPKHLEELERLAYLTPYSRSQFRRVASGAEPRDPVEKAWWFFVRCRQAMGGLGMTDRAACRWTTSTRARRGMPDAISRYLSSIEGLSQVADRLRYVVIECIPAVKVIEKYDSEATFFYCDPPYVPSTRHGSIASTYRVEMSLQDHAELLDVLKNCSAKIMISGYRSSLYDSALRDWSCSTADARSHLAGSGQRRQEVVWMNW